VNIHFDINTTSQTEWHDVRCDELPGQELGYIRLLACGSYCYTIKARKLYGGRGGLRSRLFKTLDEAKQAATATVARRLKQERDAEFVKHGCGRYYKIGPRWYYAYLDSKGEALCYPQPAASKKDALAKLQAVPLWVQHPVDVVDGVVRWNSNGSVPPADCRAKLQAEGVRFDEAKSAAADKADLEALVADYRSRPRDDSPEAQFERLAAFGPGQTIVDVLSGHRYET
jgi:hypothetical protein